LIAYLIGTQGKIIKGGPGSGNHGHAGRPGEVGGSADDGIANAAQSGGPGSGPATAAPSAPSGLRADWATYKEYAVLTYGSMFDGQGNYSYGEDKTEAENLWRTFVDRKIAILDTLSPAEKADLYVALATEKTYDADFLMDYPGMKEALDSKDPAKIVEALKGVPKTERMDARHHTMLLASRLDEENAKAVFDKLIAQRIEDKKLRPTVYGPGSNMDDNKRDVILETSLTELAVVGPSNAFREMAARRIGEALGYSPTSAIGAKSLDENIQEMVDNWTASGNTPGNPWVHTAAIKAFGGPDQVLGYWNHDTYGVIYADPAPGYVEAAKAIYQKTQTFYSKKKGKEFPVFRGVRTEASVRSPLESWSLNASTAKKFDGHAIMERKEPVSRVLMTWESMKGVFPPEENLKGKKEVVLLGLDWTKP